jgi:hypothetical protein
MYNQRRKLTFRAYDEGFSVRSKVGGVATVYNVPVGEAVEQTRWPDYFSHFIIEAIDATFEYNHSEASVGKATDKDRGLATSEHQSTVGAACMATEVSRNDPILIVVETMEAAPTLVNLFATILMALVMVRLRYPRRRRFRFRTLNLADSS